ncbi:c-type cytochrome domain-containing protein [Aurantibacter sp.]|uniref:c-type cytochrome domain-containing protein n=1 Tax=Aurantibacter sp. TaxID=2807103 RepID=UPI00326668AD
MLALEFSTFLGRFHPLFVHLPIGFLILAILLEWFENFRKVETRSKLIPIAWLLGAVSAAAAAFSGWWLGETGLYEEDMLFSHRWLGIALVIFAFVGWWLKKKPNSYSKLLQNGFNIVLLLMLSIEGHKGGNLTHGETYLTEYAPESIQGILGVSNQKDSLVLLGTPDSVLVYKDLIQPIFQVKCFACHNNEVKRGGLNMAHIDSIQLGGDGGLAIAPGNLEESELFRRITLPQKNIKFMPPTKNALTYDEIKTVEWWINKGASYEDPASTFAVDENIKPVLLRRFGLDMNPKPWYETVTIAPADSTKITALINLGFTVNTLGATNPLLDIKYSGNDLTQEKIKALEEVKNHITWLSLARTNVESDWLSSISGFTNLTRLQLENTNISDNGISHLTGLSHLESLNLYGTKVTDSSLSNIEKMGGLKRVYLWGTKVNPVSAKNISDNKEDLEIILGEG